MSDLNYADAAHLLRRLGFGGSPEEIQELVSLGRERAVDFLLDFERVDHREIEQTLNSKFPFLEARSENEINETNFSDIEIRLWWISRMVMTRHPLEEKLTLFWHNFFATSLDKVPVVHMYTQNLDLRRLALARFDDLLLTISQGAAMLIWLDGVVSTKTNPNENFARELQELFSMGTHDVVTGEANYSEEDVKEISRAFTGWRFRKQANNPSPFAYEWYLDTNEADFGSKTIYGQSANFSGEDVIQVLANKRATARYLVSRFFEFFVRPLDPMSAEDSAIIEQFADVYFEKNHSIRELLRAIFKSDLFFSPQVRFALIKNPAELIIGSMRAIEAYLIFDRTKPGERDRALERSFKDMGMNLFSPPDVFGWKLNLGFISNDSMIERLNFPDTLLLRQPHINSHEVTLISFANSKKMVKKALEVLGLFEIDKPTQKRMQGFLQVRFDGKPFVWNDNPTDTNAKIRNLYRLAMTLPEYQLN